VGAPKTDIWKGDLALSRGECQIVSNSSQLLPTD
jgi:hypothetical protein